MKNLGIFAMGMCLGLIFKGIPSGDTINSTIYYVPSNLVTDDEEESEETTING